MKRVKGARARRLGIVAGLAILIASLALGLALTEPAPPRTLTMAVGPPDDIAHAFGQRYREILARQRVRLRVVSTNGSLESLARLRDPQSGVSVAFLQSGITDSQSSPQLRSLGTVFYEPVWAFWRGFEPQMHPGWADGRRFAVGPEGSGTRKLALDLLTALGVDISRVRLLDLVYQPAADALLAGQVDVVVLVTAWETPVVHRLLAAEEVGTLSYRRADAHIALRPYLSKVVLPQGVADLARNRPPADLVLLAAKASIVVREDLHPALQYLLLQAAAEVHSTPSVFQQAGQFPASEPIDLPLSQSAVDYYKSGSPFLQRYLPFWVAVMVAQLAVVLIPVVGVAYPLLRVAPAVYAWGMRRRIFNLYGELKFLEASLEMQEPNVPVDDVLAELDRLEQRANRLRVPVAFAHFLYTLRHHISLVRARLQQRAR